MAEIEERDVWNPQTAIISDWCEECLDRIHPGDTIYMTRSGLGPLCEPCGSPSPLHSRQ